MVEAVRSLLEERLHLPVQIRRSTDPSTTARGALLHLDRDGEPLELDLQIDRSTSSVHRKELLDRIHRSSDRARGLLLAAELLPGRFRAELREREIDHVDLAGNVFIREPGFYVWLDADRKAPPVRQWRERSHNPFSKRASFVLRALLEHPRTAWGVRELAVETGLSVGHASDVSKELVRRGYAGESNGGISLRDGVAALCDWIAAYTWSRNRVRSFVVPFAYSELASEVERAMKDAAPGFARTMLSGADLFAPHVQHEQMHLYVPPEQAERAAEVVAQQLYGEAVPRGGTLHVMSPYYGEAAFYGARNVLGTRVVSPIQLFIDLARYPLRGAEAARMLAIGPIAGQLHLSGGEVRELTSTLE